MLSVSYAMPTARCKAPRWLKALASSVRTRPLPGVCAKLRAMMGRNGGSRHASVMAAFTATCEHQLPGLVRFFDCVHCYEVAEGCKFARHDGPQRRRPPCQSGGPVDRQLCQAAMWFFACEHWHIELLSASHAGGWMVGRHERERRGGAPRCGGRIQGREMQGR